MKKKELSDPDLDLDDDLRPHYPAEFFRNMKPNRFAGMDLKFKGRPPIVLDADVAEVFDSSEGSTRFCALSSKRCVRPLPVARERQSPGQQPRLESQQSGALRDERAPPLSAFVTSPSRQPARAASGYPLA
jgi:hypothetical protein